MSDKLDLILNKLEKIEKRMGTLDELKELVHVLRDGQEELKAQMDGMFSIRLTHSHK